MTRRSRKVSKQRSGSHKKPRSSRTPSIKRRVRLVRQDMLKNRSLSFTRASRRRRIDPRTARNFNPGWFRKDSSARIRAYAVPRRQKTLYIPWFEPGEVMPVKTKNRKERLLLGRWMAALNAAGHDDFSQIDKFPKNTRIGGVLLPTKHAEIQQILVSLAEQESPFEGLYRTIVRRS
jgi:hypothetical protein